ncbi:MAG: hypothetical protein ACKVTZ_17980 [Bacteroidia bacterium]
MTGSQQSYETQLGRFQSALTLLLADNNYSPTNALITKAALTSFSDDLAQYNNLVTLSISQMKDKRDERRNISFIKNSSTPDITLEAILKNVCNYLAAEYGESNVVYKQIKDFVKKLNSYRTTKKNKKTEEVTVVTHKAEGTFTSLAGYSRQVVQLLQSPGLVYTPSNVNISIANIDILAQKVTQLNSDIALLQQAYSQAVINRKMAFTSEEGLIKRISSVKKYLASYEGGKKNAKYLQFCDALKNG